MATLRKLQDNDAAAYADFRRKALLESPLTFGSSPTDDRFANLEAIRDYLRRAPDAVIIGAFQEQLVGTVGLSRHQHLKSSHKADLWGMCVAASHRRQGVAGKLLEAAIQHARTLPDLAWIHLCVTSAAPGAQRLYERAGFRVWGTESDALRHDGQAVVEYHMALHLAAG